MPTNSATSTANSQRHNHIVTIQPATSQAGGGDDGNFREDFLKALHALEIRVVKLEQLVKFGGFIFMALQLGVTIYFGAKGH